MMNSLLMTNQVLLEKEQMEKYTEEVVALFSNGYNFHASGGNVWSDSGSVRDGLNQDKTNLSQTRNLREEGQLLCMVLDIFEHFEIPVIIRWNNITSMNSWLNIMENIGMLDRSELDQLTMPVDGEEVTAFEIVDQKSRDSLVTGTITGSSCPVAKWKFDIQAITYRCIEIQEANIAAKRSLDAIIVSRKELLPISQKVSAEFRDAGFEVEIEQTPKVHNQNLDESLGNSDCRYIVILEESQVDLGRSPVTLIDTKEKNQMKVVIDEAIHVMTQVLL